MSFILIISAIVLLFSLSGVNAATHNMSNSNTTTQIQDVIDNDSDMKINLADGTYSLSQINSTRNTTIIGQSKDNVIIFGTSILFNITTSNVKIINLTICGFNTAMIANKSSYLL